MENTQVYVCTIQDSGYAMKIALFPAPQKLSAGFSHRTIQYIHITLRKSLHDAVKLGMLVRNPADAVEPPKVQRRDMRAMSEYDIHIFLEYAKSTPYYSLFYMALFTGMRRSELLALRWCDIDLILCQLSVTRALHHLQDGSQVIRQPKTAKGHRLISLSPSTIAVLEEHRERQEQLRKNIGSTFRKDDLVFCHGGCALSCLPPSITTIGQIGIGLLLSFLIRELMTRVPSC